MQLHPNRNNAYECQGQDQEENKYDKSCYIPFSYTVIDPCTVMIILLNANPTNIAVITSFGFFILTLETIFSRFINVIIDILFLSCF